MRVNHNVMPNFSRQVDEEKLRRFQPAPQTAPKTNTPGSTPQPSQHPKESPPPYQVHDRETSYTAFSPENSVIPKSHGMETLIIARDNAKTPEEHALADKRLREYIGANALDLQAEILAQPRISAHDSHVQPSHRESFHNSPFNPPPYEAMPEPHVNGQRIHYGLNHPQPQTPPAMHPQQQMHQAGFVGQNIIINISHNGVSHNIPHNAAPPYQTDPLHNHHLNGPQNHQAEGPQKEGRAAQPHHDEPQQFPKAEEWPKMPEKKKSFMSELSKFFKDFLTYGGLD